MRIFSIFVFSIYLHYAVSGLGIPLQKSGSVKIPPSVEFRGLFSPLTVLKEEEDVLKNDVLENDVKSNSDPGICLSAKEMGTSLKQMEKEFLRKFDGKYQEPPKKKEAKIEFILRNFELIDLAYKYLNLHQTFLQLTKNPEICPETDLNTPKTLPKFIGSTGNEKKVDETKDSLNLLSISQTISTMIEQLFDMEFKFFIKFGQEMKALASTLKFVEIPLSTLLKKTKRETMATAIQPSIDSKEFKLILNKEIKSILYAKEQMKKKLRAARKDNALLSLPCSVSGKTMHLLKMMGERMNDERINQQRNSQIDKLLIFFKRNCESTKVESDDNGDEKGTKSSLEKA